MLDTIVIIMLIICVGLLIINLINLIMSLVEHRIRIKHIKKEYEMLIKRIEDESNGSDSEV